MVDILNKIAAYKRKEVAELMGAYTESELDMAAKAQIAPRGFFASLAAKASSGPALIAEVKKASPSKGLIRADFDPAYIAKAYENGGAACLSVLTDTPSFQGSEAAFKQARSASTLPTLRKDFIVDTVQIAQSRAMGADCILIIMAMIDDDLAADLFAASQHYGMDALIETHDPDEVERALKLGGRLLGINNRNLRTFETKLETFKTTAANVPDDAFLVAESGIFTPEDVLELAGYGAQAYLVGESLMRQEDITAATRRLLGQSA